MQAKQIKINRRNAILTAIAAMIAAVTGKMTLSPDVVQAVTPPKYPGEVVTWTEVNPGDVVQPSHINQLYAEVKAIEDALLNTGLQHDLKVIGDIRVEG